MLWNDDPLRTRNMAPQPPLPPEIEGYLKKLKRKTSNLTGGWNKRWFFVDPKRLEFGYAKSKALHAAKSSIYLNDITAVLQFDDTHFQVESRTRNFFLCGDSKASTTCWVKSLDEYRRKLIEYEKDLAKLAALTPASASAVSPPVAASVAAASSRATNQAPPSVDPSASQRTKKTAEPARDSQDTSSSLSVSVSSSSNLAEDKPARHANAVETAATVSEHRSPSPIDAPRRHERRESNAKASSAAAGGGSSERPRDRESRGRGRDKHDASDRVSDERERDAASDERTSKRDRSTSSQRRTTNSSKQTLATGSSPRTNSARGTARPAAHPTHGYVMHAWMDEYDC